MHRVWRNIRKRIRKNWGDFYENMEDSREDNIYTAGAECYTIAVVGKN